MSVEYVKIARLKDISTICVGKMTQHLKAIKAARYKPNRKFFSIIAIKHRNFLFEGEPHHARAAGNKTFSYTRQK